jgi:hypothetical protein
MINGDRYVVGAGTNLLSGYQITLLVPFLPERVVDWITNAEFMKKKD